MFPLHSNDCLSICAPETGLKAFADSVNVVTAVFATIPNPLIASEHPKLYWTSWGATPLVPRVVRPPQEAAA
jgi:hypothetical protein